MKLVPCSIAIVFSAVPAVALAQAGGDAYPARPIRLIVPYAPGGGADFCARIIASKLPELIGQNIVVDNRPGAAGLIGTEIVARAPADGYTLLLADSALTINVTFYKSAKYDAVRDFAPLTTFADTPYMLAVAANSPFQSTKDMIAAAKAQPGKITFGSGGSGAGSHLTGELFQLRAGVSLTHVPYKGVGPAIADMVAGQISVAFTSAPGVMGLIRANRVRALGVATPKRSVFLPDVPTFREQGFPVEVGNWYGVATVHGTPKAVLDRLHASLVRILGMADVKERLAQGALEPVPVTQEVFRKMVAEDVKIWAEVVKSAMVATQ